MRYALISDIHANLPALEAVLADIAARPDVGAIYHLGDLVGYAPWPNETIDRLRIAGVPGIAGNYDSTVATDYKRCGCRYEDARQEELSHLSYEWTRVGIGYAKLRLVISKWQGSSSPSISKYSHRASGDRGR
jgi:predicted phosphodiesterase